MSDDEVMVLSWAWYAKPVHSASPAQLSRHVAKVTACTWRQACAVGCARSVNDALGGQSACVSEKAFV